MFVQHPRLSERRLSEFDGKADPKVTVAMASRKLSGVMFIDVSEKNENKEENFLFLNPNADNPLPGFLINSQFRACNVIIEDFEYDNY